MKFDKSQLLLYAVTDRSWTGEMSLHEQVEETLKAGVTMLQLREKNMNAFEMLKEAEEIKKLTRQYQIPLIINDCVEAAIRCNADGVHVGQSDMEAGDVRALLGPDKILGVTAKSVSQAKAAEAKGADYLGVGAIFGSTTKTDAKSMDMETLKDICQTVTIPVVAIGGINGDNILQLKGSGVWGAAVVSGIFAQKNIGRATKNLLEKSKEVVRDNK